MSGVSDLGSGVKVFAAGRATWILQPELDNEDTRQLQTVTLILKSSFTFKISGSGQIPFVHNFFF